MELLPDYLLTLGGILTDPKPEKNSEALMYASDANKTIALDQILAQKSALQQASLDRQMQLAANLELGIEKLDTKLQTSSLDYIQNMTAEENRHMERMAKLGIGRGPRVHVTSGSDIPEPPAETVPTQTAPEPIAYSPPWATASDPQASEFEMAPEGDSLPFGSF
ncbi:MAG TPA: hypothetical protein VLJ37_10060 [bacterium]|nr:hypothetical protein [bacterium]